MSDVQPDRQLRGPTEEETQLLAYARSHAEMQDSLVTLEGHLERIQALLRSTRWRAAHAVAYSLERVRDGERPGSGRDRVGLLLAEGQRLLSRAKERAAVNLQTRFVMDTGADDRVGEWLRNALTQPTLPISELDRDQVITAFMDNELARRLAGARAGGSLPKISIVMPTHQRQHVIDRAIRSVLAQTHQAWELLVTDDGGTDDTAAVVAGFEDERIRYHRTAQNHGVSAARNEALSRSSHDVIAYLDSDNYWEPEYLEVVAAAFRDAPDRSSAYTGQWLVAARADEPDSRTALRFTRFNRSLLENRNYVDLNCFSHRRSMVDQHGDFNESLPRLVDWDLVLRYTASEVPITIPVPLSTYVFGSVTDQLTHRYSMTKVTAELDASAEDGNGLELPLPAPAVAAGVRLIATAGAATTVSPRAVDVVLIDQDPEWAPSALAGLATNGVNCVADLLTTVVSVGDVAMGDATILPARATLADAVDELDLTASRDLLLLSTRTIIMPGALSALQDVLTADPGVKAVIPRRTIAPGTAPYAAHVGHHKAERELDIGLSSLYRNVIGVLDEERGLVEISYSPIFCVLLSASIVPQLRLDIPLEAGDGPLSIGLFQAVRAGVQSRAAYAGAAKAYHLLG